MARGDNRITDDHCTELCALVERRRCEDGALLREPHVGKWCALVVALLVTWCVACGDNVTRAPDASTLPTCASLGCDPVTYSHECVATRVCTCPVPGAPRGAPPQRCDP